MDSSQPRSPDDRVRRVVRLLAHDRGVSTAELQQLLEMSAETLRRRLLGNSRGAHWTWVEVLKLAEFFDVGLDVFLSDRVVLEPPTDRWCAVRDSNPEPAD